MSRFHQGVYGSPCGRLCDWQHRHCMQQSHMGNTPSPKTQEEYQETLSNMTAGKEVQESASSSQEEDEVVDPAVTNRMLSRVFVFAGLPVLFGLLLYPFFYYLKVRAPYLSTVLRGRVLLYRLAMSQRRHAGCSKDRPADGLSVYDTVIHLWDRAAGYHVWCYVSKLGSSKRRQWVWMDRISGESCSNHEQKLSCPELCIVLY